MGDVLFLFALQRNLLKIYQKLLLNVSKRGKNNRQLTINISELHYFIVTTCKNSFAVP